VRDCPAGERERAAGTSGATDLRRLSMRHPPDQETEGCRYRGKDSRFVDDAVLFRVPPRLSTHVPLSTVGLAAAGNGLGYLQRATPNIRRSARHPAAKGRVQTPVFHCARSI